MSGALAQFPARKHPGTFWQTLRIIGSCHAGCADNMAIKCSVIPARLLLFFGVFFILFPLYFVHLCLTMGISVLSPASEHVVICSDLSLSLE